MTSNWGQVSTQGQAEPSKFGRFDWRKERKINGNGLLNKQQRWETFEKVINWVWVIYTMEDHFLGNKIEKEYISLKPCLDHWDLFRSPFHSKMYKDVLSKGAKRLFYEDYLKAERLSLWFNGLQFLPPEKGNIRKIWWCSFRCEQLGKVDRRGGAAVGLQRLLALCPKKKFSLVIIRKLLFLWYDDMFLWKSTPLPATG